MSKSPSHNSSYENEDEDNQETGRSVQFGKSPMITESSSDESTSTTSSSISIKSVDANMNEKLRHQTSPIQIFLPEGRHLDILLAKTSVAILKNCIKEMAILREMNKISASNVNLEYIPLLEKYNSPEYDIENVLNADESFLKIQKFKKDICWIEQVLKITIKDLKITSDFGDLEKVLNDYRLTKEEEQTLLASREFNTKELKKLRYYMDVEKRNMNQMLQRITEKLGNYKDQLNDDMAEISVKLSYLKEWEKSRSEQNKIILQQQEDSLNEIVKKMNKNSNIENRVHEEMNLFLQSAVSDLQVDIESWMEKYDKDLEEKEQQVERLKVDLEMQRDKYAEIESEYNSRQQKIEEYKIHKEKMRQEAEELERRNRAATKIQAWWRGTMYRKGLGPYRKKKGKGKKGEVAKSKKNGKK